MFLRVPTVLRSSVIIMLNDSAEACVKAPTLASTRPSFFDRERRSDRLAATNHVFQDTYFVLIISTDRGTAFKEI